jgi:hypothetical protein
MTTKTKPTVEIPGPTAEQVEAFSTAQEVDTIRAAQWGRESALEKALAHHKINGGMLTVPQLIDNAKMFHAYITGESK